MILSTITVTIKITITVYYYNYYYFTLMEESKNLISLTFFTTNKSIMIKIRNYYKKSYKQGGMKKLNLLYYNKK